MESKSIMPESRVTKEQEIISLYYHNGLSVVDICYRYKYTQRSVAEVLVSTTLQQQDDSRTTAL